MIKPIKKKFGMCVDSSLHVIESKVHALRSNADDTKIKKSGRTLVISNFDEYNDYDDVLSIVHDVIKETFGKKPKKVVHLDSFNGKLWARFKKKAS